MLSFRKAQPDDAAAVTALVESAYRGEASKVGWTTEADLLGGQRTDLAGTLEAINNPKGAVILAFEADQLLACAQIDAHEPGLSHFGMFAVRPDWQSAGVGRALLAECEQRAQTYFGCHTMVMWVIWLRESLIAFYARRGYHIVPDVRHAFPYGDARFGEPKRDDLYFIEMRKSIIN